MTQADPAPGRQEVPGLAEARVPLVRRSDAGPLAREVFDAAYDQYGGIANLYRVLANSPELLHAWAQLAWPLRERMTADRGLRELAVLRIARTLSAPYVWAHHHEFAVEAGLPAQVIDLIEDAAPWAVFPPPYRSVVRAADELTQDASISDECFAELGRLFPVAEVVELLTTIAFYTGVARLTRALQIPLEPRPGWHALPDTKEAE
jgi:4-carboxymuconolactone decarboxylase